ncbi:PfkB family carbohydrate kinase [Crossiella sp. SN42]|uniref:PfkB family carbohydrate kinase n=1 Tax=Crossiella sp. SN42 TaxID=2944808 RepID=UPI00207C800A|nr:PfkB family carbohydrate kinase [Crossiella sp. SN42]MCO1577046.1 PfkB family carbohydrate kinase [Crossiella sp. SN42]
MTGHIPGRVLCVGLATLDVLHRVPGFPAPNHKVTATRQDVAAGGPACNAAVTAAATGSAVTLLTALGDHPLARLIHQELAGFGITVRDCTPDRQLPPAVSAITVHERTGDRNIVSTDAGGVSARPPADLSALLAAADVVLIDGHHPDLARAAVRASAPVVFDAGRYRPHHDELLAAADVVICSGDYRLPGQEGRAETLAALREIVRTGAMTAGGEPVVYWDRELGTGEVAVSRVPVRDTLGAGDALHGAFASSVAARGWVTAELAEHLAWAVGVASVRVRYPGPRDWLRYAPSVTEKRQ